ncbi:TPA: hypothetical protein RQN23_000661 [Aeromonas veronii]|nr:hypothetical protein [Aeromonas veronii]
MTEVKPGQVISLKDDGDGFNSQIRNKVSGKKLYVLAVLRPLGSNPADCNLKLLVAPKTTKGKFYIWTPRLSVVGLSNVVFHGEFDINGLDADIIKKATMI